MEGRVGLYRRIHSRAEVVNAFQVACVVLVKVIQQCVGRGEGLHDFDHVRVKRGMKHLLTCMYISIGHKEGRANRGISSRKKEKEKPNAHKRNVEREKGAPMAKWKVRGYAPQKH